MVSVLINSQGAVVVAMLPLAYSLGISGPVLLGVLPSVYGYFFIPNYPSDIATVNFDRSGTTIISSGGEKSQGGSTITQQLLKNNVFEGWATEKDKMAKVRRKIQEQYLAVNIERELSK
jgi:hypothetical protein